MNKPTNIISVNGKQLISLEGAAVALDLSLSTIRRMVKASRLRRVRVLGRWLVDWSSIETILDGRK
jgi:hypothetical protein